MERLSWVAESESGRSKQVWLKGVNWDGAIELGSRETNWVEAIMFGWRE